MVPDLYGIFEEDEIENLMKNNVSVLLNKVAEMEFEHSLFSTCIEGSKTVPGKSCEMTQPKCSQSNIKEKFGKKYIVVDCYYDKNESYNKKYILNKIIIYPSAYGDHITMYSVSLDANKESLIESHKKIFLDIFNDAFEARLKE